jgi:adenylate cyclase class 2
MPQEIEAKFRVRSVAPIRQHLLSAGAHLEIDRHLERNWRYDLPNRSLTAAGKVLRLRQAARTTLTFKQASPDPLVRHEWELEVVPLETAQALLEQLGYQVILVYEKYRQVYSLGDAHFMLDELPFGDFVEVETGSPAGLEQTASRAGLDWGRRIDGSYLELFERLQLEYDNQPEQATFEAFRRQPQISGGVLGLADASQSLPEANQ